MADDASLWFDLSPHHFPAFFHSAYHPHSPVLWHLYHPPIEVLSSVISALCRHPYKAVTSPTAAPSPCVDSRHPSASTSSWTTFSSTLISHLSRSFRCTYYISIMVTSPPEPLSSGCTWLQRRVRLLRRPTFWRDAATPASLPGRTHNISTIASPACSSTSLTKTPLPNRIMILPLAYSWQPQQQLTLPARYPSALPILSRFSCSSV